SQLFHLHVCRFFALRAKKRHTNSKVPKGKAMVRYLLGRVIGLVIVFGLVSIVAFLLMHSIPGGPFSEEKSPLPPAAKANILRKYGLDQPLYVQYLRYMGSALQ